MASSAELDFNSRSTDDGNEPLSVNAIQQADNSLLRKLGYKSEFKREFSVRVQQY